MKKFPKIVSILLTALCLFVFIFGICGYSTQYGDITTTLASGAKDLYKGLGVEKYIELTYTYEEADDKQIDELKSVISKRLEGYDIDDYVISVDTENKVVSVLVAWGSKTTFSASSVFNGIYSVGKLEIRQASDTDDEGEPTGDIICTNEDLVNAEASVNTYYSSLYRNEFTLTFSGESKDAIETFTEQAIASSDNSQGKYSVWIDGELINTVGFSKVISDGVLSCGDTTYTYDSTSTSSYETYAIALNGGILPVELLQETIYYHNSPNYSDRLTAILWGIAAVCALTGFYWIVSYKLLGLSALITLTGILGTTVMVLSGSFYSSTGVFLTASSIYTLCGIVGLLILCFGYLMSYIRNTLRIQSPAKSVGVVLSSKTKNGAIITIISVVSVIILKYASLLFADLSALYDISQLIALFSIIAFVFIFLVFRCIALSVASFDKLNKEELFGGARK